jgi:hypothetical protein
MRDLTIAIGICAGVINGTINDVKTRRAAYMTNDIDARTIS